MFQVVDLTGLIDLHIHSAPDVQPRSGDDLDVVLQARQAGMRAVLLKSHVVPTPDRAAIAEKVVGDIRVFGGLALNEPLGGLNPAAVEVALKMGAKEIWMPTRSAAHALRHEGKSGGLSILDDAGRLLPAVHQIIDLVVEADAILGTGHISPEETRILVTAALRGGARKVLVTHPEASFIRMPLHLQAAIVQDGVFFERCFVDTTPLLGSLVSVAQIAHAIRTIGVHSTVLSTDFGQAGNISPVEGMRAFLSGLSGEGFSPDEIQFMAGKTPAFLLNLK